MTSQNDYRNCGRYSAQIRVVFHTGLLLGASAGGPLAFLGAAAHDVPT